MALYFENAVNFTETGAISTLEKWHSISPLLAVASYSQEKGGFVTIFDELGEPLKDLNYPYHAVSQVTALAWHPEKNILVTGWENGEIKVWDGIDKDFTHVNGPHKAPITLLEFSEKGGRLVSCDTTGSMVGWKVDTRGTIVTAFHHELKECITHLTFRISVKSNPDYDVEGLAKAAVNGDERALDLFSNWRPKTTARKFRVQDGNDNQSFFVGTQIGTIYYVNQGGACTEVLNTEGVPLAHILYHHSADSVVVMMEGLTVGHFRVDFQGHLNELVKVKLSGRGGGAMGGVSRGGASSAAAMCWTAGSCLAILTGDLVVRMWDIDTNDNYVLPVNMAEEQGADITSTNRSHVNEQLTCLSYSRVNGTLCAGSNAGRVYFWVRNLAALGGKDNVDAHESGGWELKSVSTVTGTVKHVSWGGGTLGRQAALLSVNCVTRVYVMREQMPCAAYCGRAWVAQRAAHELLLESGSTNHGGVHSTTLNIDDLQVSDVAIGQHGLAVTDGRTVQVYEFSWPKGGGGTGTPACALLGGFRCDNDGVLLHERRVLCIGAEGVALRAWRGGALVANLPTVSVEGEPIGMDICDGHLCIFTLEGYIKLFDLSPSSGSSSAHSASRSRPDSTVNYGFSSDAQQSSSSSSLSLRGEGGAPRLTSSCPAKCVPDCAGVDDFGEIIQARCNSTGNKVVFTLAASNLLPDGKLYVWDVDNDHVIWFDFKGPTLNHEPTYSTYEEDLQLAVTNEDKNHEDKSSGGFGANNSYYAACRNRVPLSVSWDTEDPRLLACSAKKLKSSFTTQVSVTPLGNKDDKANKTGSKEVELEKAEQVIVSMFYCAEGTSYGDDPGQNSGNQGGCLRVQDVRAVETDARLLAVATPYLVSLRKLRITREPMSDFVGLENCPKSTRQAVLDFSYHLSLGDMDAAFRAIKSVDGSSVAGVWSSLAKMCVKTGRLDVAGVCLGHMGDARAAALLRKATEDTNLPHEAKLAVLAVHLGMMDEAESLYTRCGRYDLLNRLQASRGAWDSCGTLLTSGRDRIHARATWHAYARRLEAEGRYDEAKEKFKLAGTHRYDVPRMLVAAERVSDLEAYVKLEGDPELWRWWGQYVESQGDMRAALDAYARARDAYSQVRVLCFLGEERAAAELASGGSPPSSGNVDSARGSAPLPSSSLAAACYHMARHYETSGDAAEAIRFFVRAKAYGNAVRLCRERALNGQNSAELADELWTVGLMAAPRDKVECARHFEREGDMEKAIVLYHRAGQLHKALDLAFKSQQYDTLQLIAAELDADSDPALVKKCAEYFIGNEQYDRAVDLLAVGKKYKEAIAVCLAHNVQLTEALAEKLTPEKDEVDEETRVTVLENLGESLLTQGQYHLAAKKFTQSGDKARAMRALLKSGDTEKIVFFAGVSRQRDVYVMAANYLQSLEWRDRPDILRHIVAFYQKGKALDLLANFYVACAQVEIDEFQNYEKALGALSEAARCLTKVSTGPQSGGGGGSTSATTLSRMDVAQHRRATETVQKHATLVKRFVDVKRLLERGDIETGIAQARQLIGTSEVESSVRRGDVYALMLQTLVRLERFAEGRQLLGEMRQTLMTGTSSAAGSPPLTYYVTKECLEKLAQGVGVPLAALVPTEGGAERATTARGRSAAIRRSVDEVEEDIVPEENED